MNNRTEIKLHKNSIKEVLPEFFSTHYPNLVSFLESYYVSMNQDDQFSFDQKIKELFCNRDVIGSDVDTLKQVMKELFIEDAYNIVTDQRLKSLRIANHFRQKGSKNGIEEFFRWLFRGESVEIEYGKNNVFIVNDSLIGTESLKYIINAELYQTFGLLIKSGRPVSEWRDLYKTYAHPAGFYFTSQIVIESVFSYNYEYMTIVELEDNVDPIYESTASGTFVQLTSVVGVFADEGDSDSIDEVLNLNNTINTFSDITIEDLDTQYDNIKELATINSPTFDDSNIVMSNTIETFDQDKYEN